MSKAGSTEFPFYKKVAWNCTSLVSNGIWGIMQGYLTYYLTQNVLLSSVSVGMVLLVSKVFDGFTDLIAGYIIERTNTRWGKGRPYSLFAIVAWIFIILLFSVPSFFSTTGKLVYVFICYTLIQSVTLTLFNCSEQVYMIRAIPNEKDKTSTLAIGGTMVTYGSTILAIVMPMLVTSLGTAKQGWMILALAIGIPSMILASLRFLLVKELPLVDAAGREVEPEKVTLSKIIKQLIHNKYVLICFGLIFAYYFGSNLNSMVMTYYFTYNIGNLNLLTYINAASLIVPLVLLLMPKVMSKLGKVKILKYGLIINLAASILRAFFSTNLIVYAITSVASSMGSLPMVYFISLLLMDCMDYGECKLGYRVESSYTAVTSAGQKLAAGIASGVGGAVMGAAGFISGAATQSTEAMRSIWGLTIIFPIAIGVILVILISIYNLDDKMDSIREELLEKRK